MAFSSRPLLSLFRNNKTAVSRFLSTNAKSHVASLRRPIMLGGLLIGSLTLYKAWEKMVVDLDLGSSLFGVVQAATKFPASQPSVFSPTKEHALYLWLHLRPDADAKKCARLVANLENLVNHVCPDADESNEIVAGVGFGQEFYAKVNSKCNKKFSYKERVGKNGNLPNTGGDIFIHAKSDSVSKLFELCELLTGQLEGQLASAEDVYSFVYRNGRDLSGFIDGTENPADETDRQTVAVDPSTGGSYAVTQRWVHDLKLRSAEKPSNLEAYVGRGLEDSVEQENKSESSHVARMTGGKKFGQKKAFEIVRQSMPYGTVSGEAGLFFIAYAKSVENFDYMLDRMVGATDGIPDDVMRLTRCVTGNYWYFPGAEELKKFA